MSEKIKFPKQEISHENLSQKVYEWLYRQIISEVLPPGARLVESEIVEALNVSRTPIREAITALMKDGLLTNVPRPHKGVYVTRLTRQQVVEIFEVRTALEGFATRLATPNLSEDELMELVQLQQRAEAAIDQNPQFALDADQRMHQLLIERAQNSRIAEILQGLNAHTQRIRTHNSRSPQAVKEFMLQRWELLDALQKRDAERAEQLMRAHIESVKKWVLSEFPSEA